MPREPKATGRKRGLSREMWQEKSIEVTCKWISSCPGQVCLICVMNRSEESSLIGFGEMPNVTLEMNICLERWMLISLKGENNFFN